MMYQTPERYRCSSDSALCCSGVVGVDGWKVGISETCRTYRHRLDVSGKLSGLHFDRHLNPFDGLCESCHYLNGERRFQPLLGGDSAPGEVP
jgi:hypothetical protein